MKEGYLSIVILEYSLELHNTFQVKDMKQTCVYYAIKLRKGIKYG